MKKYSWKEWGITRVVTRFQFWIVFILLICILIIFYFSFLTYLQNTSQNTNYVDEQPNAQLVKTTNETKFYHSFLATPYKNYDVYNLRGAQKTFNGNVDHLLHYNQDTYQLSGWKNETIYAQLILVRNTNVQQTISINPQVSNDKTSELTVSVAPIRAITAVKNRNNPTLTTNPQSIGDWIRQEETQFNWTSGPVGAMWITCHIGKDIASGLHKIKIDLKSTIDGTTIVHTHYLMINVNHHTMADFGAQSAVQTELWQNPKSIDNYYQHLLGQHATINTPQYWSYQDPYLHYLIGAGVKVYTLRLMDLIQPVWNPTSKHLTFTFVDHLDLATYLKHVLRCGFKTIQLLFVDPVFDYHRFLTYVSQYGLPIDAKQQHLAFLQIQKFVNDFFATTSWYDSIRPDVEIAFDELPVKTLKTKLNYFNVFNNLHQFKLATTVNYQFWSAEDRKVLNYFDDLSINYQFTQYVGPDQKTIRNFVDQRTKANKLTSIYSCTADYPANFIKSQPGESALIWFYGFKNHINNFLRWSYTYWPTEWHSSATITNGDTKAFGLETGDLFLVYPSAGAVPGVDPSLRMDMILFGEEQMDKIQTLMSENNDMHQILDHMIHDMHWPSNIKPLVHSYVYYISTHFNAIATLNALVDKINSI